MQTDIVKKITIEKKPGSLVALVGEIPFSELEKHRAAAVRAIGENVNLDGFRKGHIPESVLVRTVGEMAILTEMAERALRDLYPLLVEDKKLDVIGYPSISITKLAKGNPLGFSITVAVVPDISLPDYFGIARDINKSKESKEVTDEEVTTQINDILRQKIAYERLQEKAKKNAAEHAHEAHVHDHTHEHPAHEKVDDIKLPELTDEYVKSLGKPGQFSTVEEFKTKIKEHLTLEKAREVDSRHRAKITDAIIEKTKMGLPKVMVDAEIGQMFAQMEEDLKRAQLTMEDYLSHIKKTKEDLTKEWTPSAEKRAKLQLALNEIAKKESITPDAGSVDQEISHLIEHYKDADEKRVRIYVTSVLTNEAVLKKLEETT